MVNPSDAHGTLIIRKNNSNATLKTVKKLLKESKNFDYGYLIIDPIDVDFDKELAFSTSGRWSLYSTLEHYFKNFKTLTKDEQKELNNLSFHFEYVDYESGCELFEFDMIDIQTVYKNNKLKTKIIEEEIYPLEADAETLESYDIYDNAYDTFTVYGVTNLQKALKRDIDWYKNYNQDFINKILHTDTKKLIQFFKNNNVRDSDSTDFVDSLLEYELV